MNRSRRGLYIISFLCSYQEMTQRFFYVGSPCMWYACIWAKDKNSLVPCENCVPKVDITPTSPPSVPRKALSQSWSLETRRLVPHKMRRIDISL